MMVGLSALGIWFLVMSIGASYSFPAKKDPHSDYTASESNHEQPASGFLEATSGSSATSNRFLQNAPHKQLSRAQMRPMPALYRRDTLPAPVHLGYDGLYQMGLSSFHVPLEEENWAVQLPVPFSGGPSSRHLQRSGSKPWRLPDASPPVSLQPEFQSGEMSYTEKVYDRGNYNLETEGHGPPSRHRPIPAQTRLPVSSFMTLNPAAGGFWSGSSHNHMVMSVPRNRKPSFLRKA